MGALIFVFPLLCQLLAAVPPTVVDFIPLELQVQVNASVSCFHPGVLTQQQKSG